MKIKMKVMEVCKNSGPGVFHTGWIADKAGLKTKQAYTALASLVKVGFLERGGPNDCMWMLRKDRAHDQ